jgi:hypothetical protein
VLLAGQLLALLLATLALLQGVCFLLARGLGVRLERRAAALGFLLPLLVLSPWLGGSRLIVPSDLLQRIVPDAPPIRFSSSCPGSSRSAMRCAPGGCRCGRTCWREAARRG